MLMHELPDRIGPKTMGELQHFCLRWNNYQNSITSAFENLRGDEDFIDVTLACDGKTLKAHRVVLSACSPYFREMLKSTPCTHPIIVLQDVVFDDLNALVEFIYHGEVNVQQKNLTSFLKTAEVLKVSGLTQQSSAIQSTQTASLTLPSHNLCDDNSPTIRFPARSPDISRDDKTSLFQPPFRNDVQPLKKSDDDRNCSPNAPQSSSRLRRHIRSPTSIKSTYPQGDSPIPLKRTKSVDSIAIPTTSIVPVNDSIDTSSHKYVALSQNVGRLDDDDEDDDDDERNKKHAEKSCISTTAAAASSRDDDYEPSMAVDFSTSGSKNRGNDDRLSSDGRFCPPPNFSFKSEPIDLAAVNCQNADNGRDVEDDEDDDDDDDDEADSSPCEDTMSDQSPPPIVNPYPPLLLEHEEAFLNSYRNHPRSLHNKLLVPGTPFNFDMVAAFTADSLTNSSFNYHQTQQNLISNVVVDRLNDSSPGLKKVFPCLACGKVLCSKASLKRHVADKHASHQEEYRCAICERVYCSRNSLMTHIYTYHKTRPTLLIPPSHNTPTLT